MPPMITFNPGAIGSENLSLAATGYLVVFASLTLLFLFFTFLPRIIAMAKALEGKGKTAGDAVRKKEKAAVQSGEVGAAIAMAIHLHFNELHDQEKAIITIHKTPKTYSPWNSKIYNVFNLRGFQR